MACAINNLHQELLNYYSTEAKADEVYAMIGTDYFKEVFGDWENLGTTEEFRGRTDNTGLPSLKMTTNSNPYKRLPYFTRKDGKPLFLDNKMLNLPHEGREALVQMAMFQLFGDNVLADLDTFDNSKLSDLETKTETGTVHSILGGNKKDLRDLKSMVKDRLESMKVKVNEREDLADELDQLDSANNERTIDLRASFEKNDKDNASANMKFFFSFIPEMDKDGNPKIKEVVIDEDSEGKPVKLPYVSFLPFDQVWKQFSQTLADTVDTYTGENVVKTLFDKMLDKIDQAYPENPSIQYALKKIVQMPQFKQNEFVQAFAMHKVHFYTSLINKSGTELGFKFFRSDAATNPANSIQNDWKESIKGSKLFQLVNGKYQINEAKKVKFLQSYNELVKRVTDDLQGNKPFVNKHIEDFEKIIKYLGINVNPETVSAYVYQHVNNKTTALGSVLTALDKFKFIIKDIEAISDNTIKDNVIKDVYTKSGIQQVKNLAELESQFRKDLSENTVMGPEGKKYWTYSMPSYLSNKIKRITTDISDVTNNAVNNGELPARKGFYTNSIWLDLLSDPIANKEFFENFNITTFNNLRQENVGDEGTDNKDISEAEQIMDMLNKALYPLKKDPAMKLSSYYTPTPADKGRMMHIIGAPLFSNVLETYSTADDTHTFSDQVVDIFAKYVFDEIERASEELVKIENPKVYYNYLYKDYHWVEEKGKYYFYGIPDTTQKSGYRFVTDRTIEDAVPVGNAFKSALLPDFNFFNPPAEFKEYFKNGKLKVPYSVLLEDKNFKDLITNELSTVVNNNREYYADLQLFNPNGELTIVDSDIYQHYKNTYTDNALATEAVITDFTINQMISNIEFSKVFSGDWAYYKNMVDLSKRYPATYTDGIPLNLREGDPASFELAVGPNIKIPSYTMKEFAATSPYLVDAYKNINATDAQGYITLDRWYFVMSRSNHWNPKYEEAYQRVITNTQTAEDYNLMAQPVKGVHFENTLGVPTFVKYSAAPLIPSVVKGTPLGRLLDAMVAQGVDEYVVVDGVKVGAITPSDVVDENMNIRQSDIKLNSITLRNNNYKIQQDLRPKGVKQTLIGSQIKKILLTNLKEKNLPDAQLLNDVLSAMSDKELMALEKSTGISQTGEIINKGLLWERLESQLSERGATENLKLALQKNLDLDVIANYRQKIQNGIMSIINNATVKLKSNGGSYIQMSSWGLNEFSPEADGIKWLGGNDKTKFTGLKAPHLIENKDGTKTLKPGQVFITSSYISKYIPNWKKMSEKDLNAIIDSRLLKIIGYRIPNQGRSSNDVLEIVGILPESYGDTIIPYVDITTKTGSDFDIDKMYVMIPNLKAEYDNKTKGEIISELMQLEESDLVDMIYAESSVSQDYINSLTSNKKKAKQNLANEIVINGYFSAEQLKLKSPPTKLNYITSKPNAPLIEQSKQALENMMMEQFFKLLEDPDLYEQLMRPLDENLLADDLDDLYGVEDSNVGMQFFSPAYQLTKKFDNAGGKSGVGITANQLVDHAWTQLKNVQYEGNIMIGNIDLNTGRTTFAGEYDVNNKIRITDTLSWFLTLYVDIAKDPKIAKGNHNTYTANTVFMLARAGVPYKLINRIVGQNSVKLLSKISLLRRSRVAQRDIRPLRNAVIEELSKQYEVSGDLVIDLIKEKFDGIEMLEALNSKESINKLQDTLEKAIKEKPTSTNAFISQVKMLDMFMHLQSIGEDFAKTVIGSKQDVNGSGKDFMSAFVDFNMRDHITTLGFTNIDEKFNNTFLGTAYKNSTLLSKNVMEKLFITSNQAAQNVYNSMAKLLNSENKYLLDSRLGTKLEKSYFAHILGSKAFNMSQERIGKLFVGEDTVYDHVLNVKQLLPDNYFLNSLKPRMEGNKKFIKMDSTRNNSPETLNEITRSWEELLTSPIPEARKLGNELIYYSFYTSGFQTNISSFFEHIPHERLAELVEDTIAEAKGSKLNISLSMNTFIDKFFRNNWNDDELVPIVNGSVLPATNTFAGLLSVRQEAGTENKKTEKLFVKTKKTNENSSIPIELLYKKIGSIKLEKGNIIHLYKQVNKLGYTDSKGNNIYEWNNIQPDTKSVFKANNINSQAFIDKINNSEQAFLQAVNNNPKTYSTFTIKEQQISFNNPALNRNSDEDLNRATDEGLFDPNCNN
jgi:hypothetical protein